MLRYDDDLKYLTNNCKIHSVLHIYFWQWVALIAHVILQ